MNALVHSVNTSAWFRVYIILAINIYMVQSMLFLQLISFAPFARMVSYIIMVEKSDKQIEELNNRYLVKTGVP
jgi:hypothetical protein